MSLSTVRTALAAHITANVAVDAVIAVPPNHSPDSWTAYVWPGGPWVRTPDEDRGFCPSADVSMVVDLIADAADYVVSEAWLVARLTELWVACAPGVEIDDDTIEPQESDPPALVAVTGGKSFLRVRTLFTPYRWEIV